MGTVPYFSVNAQQKKTQSYRDDLESLGYAILNMLVGDHKLWFELQSPYSKDFIDAKLKFINSDDPIHPFSDDPRLLHIRTYLKSVRSLDFGKIPDYASLSNELSKINQPIIEAVAKLKTDVSRKLSESL